MVFISKDAAIATALFRALGMPQGRIIHKKQKAVINIKF
jgi:hypothetical protein